MTRKGECNRCGECCKLGKGCIAYEDKECMIYEQRDKPFVIYNGQRLVVNGCSSYPTERDFKKNRVPSTCGYYME